MTRVFLQIMQKVFQKSFFKEQATNCFSRYFTMNALFCMRIKAVPMHKKCPCLELFSSIFFRIRTEYEDLLCKSPYSVRMRENTDQKNFEYGHFNALRIPIFQWWFNLKMFLFFSYLKSVVEHLLCLLCVPYQCVYSNGHSFFTAKYEVLQL